MATYRERREARAERLREWAAKRQTAAAAVFKAHEVYHGDHAFNTQPGHIPERARVIAREDRACESLAKARGMAERADGIEHQMDRAIYSDDPDAKEAIEARIADLEAERERVKAFNASCRRGAPDLSILDERQRADIATTARVVAYQLSKGGGFPSYHTALLGANIRRYKERLAGLSRPAPIGRWIEARYAGACADCGARVVRGATVLYSKAESAVRCSECGQKKVAYERADWG